MMFPKKSLAILLFSFIWMCVGTWQWVVRFPDFSNLLFSIGFFLAGVYVAYDQWFKESHEGELKDLALDIKEVDQHCNRLENKIIDIVKRR